MRTPTPRLAWFLLTAVGVAAVVLGAGEVVPQLAVTKLLPAWTGLAGAVVITVCFAVGLAVRTGGRPLVSGFLAVVLATAAVVSELPILVATAAASTVVLAGVFAVTATRPARRFGWVVVECVVASVVALVGALAVAAYGAPVAAGRLGYLALGGPLLVALVLAHRLGGGLHALGRRGRVMLLAGTVALLIGLVYTEALTRWGPPELEREVMQALDAVRARLGAVPMPLAVFVGVPTLAWGVFIRARSAQGWWACAFAAPWLGVVAVSLVDPARTLEQTLLSLGYGLLLGLVVGFVVIRDDMFFAGTRGHRARRREVAGARRPEPGRTHALL